MSSAPITPLQWERGASRQRHPSSYALLRAVPWLDAIIIAALFWAVVGRATLAPSVAFELPSAPFTEGAYAAGSLIAFPDPATDGRILVFFDDARYILGTDDEANLAADVSEYARSAAGGRLLLLADASIRHGDVMRIVDIVRAGGVKRIDVAVKPE